MTKTPTTILPYLSDGRLEHQSYPPAAAIQTETETERDSKANLRGDSIGLCLVATNSTRFRFEHF